jgi:hypothetical protein
MEVLAQTLMSCYYLVKDLINENLIEIARLAQFQPVVMFTICWRPR